MNTTTPTHDTQQEQLIWSLDLECIKFKLTHPGEGAEWTLDKADAVELAYKRFLVLNVRFPGQAIIPDHDIDTFWHYHILDTRKYAEDCQHCFGYFLHHFPYAGLRGADDLTTLKSNFQRTREMFRSEFGCDLVTSSADCETSGDDPDSCAPEPSCENYTNSIQQRPRPIRQLAA